MVTLFSPDFKKSISWFEENYNRFDINLNILMEKPRSPAKVDPKPFRNYDHLGVQIAAWCLVGESEEKFNKNLNIKKENN